MVESHDFVNQQKLASQALFLASQKGLLGLQDPPKAEVGEATPPSNSGLSLKPRLLPGRAQLGLNLKTKLDVGVLNRDFDRRIRSGREAKSLADKDPRREPFFADPRERGAAFGAVNRV